MSFASFAILRHIVVIIHVAGFQTIAIFMQTGESERSVDAAVTNTISDVVVDSPDKVCVRIRCKYWASCIS